MSKQENSINKKLTELKNQIDWFYGNDFSLDQAEANYKKATTLAKSLESDLENLKNRIEVLSRDFNA